MRSGKMITKGKMRLIFSVLEGNVWRSVWRIRKWILKLKGLTKITVRTVLT